MKMLVVLMFVLPLYATAQPATEKWDALISTWSLDPTNTFAFNNLSRTKDDALADGWVLNAACSVTNPFCGNRYIKDNDTSAMLLFDKNGYIAGLQVGVPKNIANGFPHAGQRPPFVENGNMYVITVYFVEPSTICSTGRTAAQFESQGTGTGLWLQNSTASNPLGNVVKVPATESLANGTSWIKVNCVPTMGIHYWYDWRNDLDCNDLLPIFLMYNKGKLNAFGWALIANIDSPRYEHPPVESFGDGPTCLKERGTPSTMHIFLTSSPFQKNRC